jgi:hypothetical protein
MVIFKDNEAMNFVECVFEKEEPGHQPLIEEVFEYIGCVWEERRSQPWTL